LSGEGIIAAPGRQEAEMAKLKVKNDLETAVRGEVQRQRGLHKNPSPGSQLLKEKVSGIASWLSKKPGISSRIPAAKVSKAVSRMVGEKKRSLCHCPICSIDSIALALNTLPPCYSRSEQYGVASSKVSQDELSEKVKTAIRKVTLLPRHPDRPVADDASVRLFDFGLYEGSRMIGPLLSKVPGACTCVNCLEDTLAFGLNHSKVRYGILMGRAMRAPPSDMEFFRHHLQGIFVKSAKVIARTPRHGNSD
jgi:hypothetical protein